MNLRDHLPAGLKGFFSHFDDYGLSKPQYQHFTSWMLGILNGYSHATEIAKRYSDKSHRSLSRFMSSSPWNHKQINKIRMKWATNILSQRYMKYFPLVIDDTVNKKYGKLLAGVGKYYSNTEKRVIWGQSIVSSHLVMAESDIPLFVDLYIKKEDYSNQEKFKSKIDFAMDQIKQFPHVSDRIGVVVTDSWYASVKIINLTVEMRHQGIFDLKSDRIVNYRGSKTSVSQLAKERLKDDFDLVKVDGRLFRVWTAKVKVPRVQRKKLRLLISQQDLIDKKTKERSWSDFKYILTTDLSMGSWLIIYLYRRRWKIETFYKFAKNCLKFAASRLESEQSITRFFIMLYFAYTYLALTRDPNCIYYEDSKSLYEAKNLLEERSFEEVIEWIYDKSIQGVDLDEIKAHFEV